MKLQNQRETLISTQKNRTDSTKQTKSLTQRRHFLNSKESYCRFTFNQKTRIPIFTTMSSGNWICLEWRMGANYKYLHFWIVEAFLNWNKFQLLYCKRLTHRYVDAKWIKMQKVITFLFGKQQKYFYILQHPKSASSLRVWSSWKSSYFILHEALSH